MPKYTSNYKLTKPLGTELYDVNVHNNNMDIIDTTLKNASNVSDEANKRSKTNEDSINALKTFQEEPFELTGNPVQLGNYEGMPMKVVSRLRPIQTGSGSPHPAGAGRNKLNMTHVGDTTWNGITYKGNPDGTVTVNGTATDLSYLNCTGIAPAGDYIFNGCPSGGDSNTGYFIRIVDANEKTYDDTGNGVAITLEEAQEITVRIVVRSGKNTANLVFKPMLRPLGDPDATFDPYENILPISGYTSIELKHSRKNFCPPFQSKELNGLTFTYRKSDYGVSVNGTATNEAVVNSRFVLPAGTYTISGELPSSTVHDGDIYVWSSDAQGIVARAYTGSNNRTFTLTKEGYVDVYLRVTSGRKCNPDTDIFYPQIELGNTVTEYEPYVCTTLSENLANRTGGNPIYGGTMDWETGRFTAEWVKVTLDGKGNDYVYAYAASELACAAGHTYIVVMKQAEDWTDAEAICDRAVQILYPGASSAERREDTFMVRKKEDSAEAGRARYHFFTNHATIAEFKAALELNPITIAFRLINPISYSLTPREISALTGVNTLSGDGEITVSGRKDILWLTSGLLQRVRELEYNMAQLEAAITAD